MKNNQDFDKIFLSKREIAILEESKYGGITYSKSADYLLEIGLIDHYKLSKKSNALVITPVGLRYIEHLHDLKEKEIKKEKTISKRYWITTAISVLALVISIIALVK